MKTIISIILFALLQQTNLLAQTEFTDSIVHQGLNRTFIVHIPPTYDGITEIPLILALHGGGSADATVTKDRLQIEEIGDTANFITVFPNGYYNDWADGRGVTDSDTAGIDDVSFLTTLKDSLSMQYAIDTSKVYIFGSSNGGMMTLRIACEEPESFSAYAAIISNLPDSVAQYCNPGKPVSVLIMPGTDDPFIPYAGGTLNPLSDGGSVVGVDSTLSFFLNNNGCTSSLPDSTQLPDLDPTDNGTVTIYNYGFCNDSSEIVLYKVIGAGHTIPGMQSPINPVPIVGYINYDIDASDEIWKFFKRHVKKDDSTVSITELETTNDFIIFPNPTNGIIYIDSKIKQELLKVAIFNMLGEKVMVVENRDYIDLKGLPSGTYFLRIQMDNLLETHKILKIE